MIVGQLMDAAICSSTVILGNVGETLQKHQQMCINLLHVPGLISIRFLRFDFKGRDFDSISIRYKGLGPGPLGFGPGPIWARPMWARPIWARPIWAWAHLGRPIWAQPIWAWPDFESI